jgi:peptidoglycan/LPS O-acetylase OafA/YrhL
MMSKPARLGQVDALRTVMCACIALNHFVPYFFGVHDPEYLGSRFFAYFTDMFFVLSGFFLTRHSKDVMWTGQSAGAFIIERVARIYPAYLVCFAFFLVIGLGYQLGYLHVDNPKRYDPEAMLPAMTMTHAWGLGYNLAFNYVGWAISGLMFCYIVFPLVDYVSRGRNSILFAIFLIALMSAELIAVGLFQRSLTDIQKSDFGLLRVIPSFLFGALLGRLDVIKLKPWMAGVFLTGALVLAFAHATPLNGISRLIAVYIVVTAVIFAEWSSITTPLSWRPLQQLSKVSYSVFLVHLIIATVFIKFMLRGMLGLKLQEMTDTDPLMAYFLLAILIVLSFAAGWIMWRIVERGGKTLVLWLATRSGLYTPVERPAQPPA